VLATARLHFVDKKLGIDAWENRMYMAEPSPAGEIDWASAAVLPDTRDELETQPPNEARFAQTPAKLLHAPSYAAWRKQLESHVQRAEVLKVMRYPAAAQTMAPGDDEAEFRARVSLSLRERRDDELEQLREKFGPRLARLEDQRRRAEDRIARERAQLSDRKLQTAVSVGTSLLGALFGRKRISATNAGRVGSAARSAGRIGKEHQDVERAEESLEVIEQRRVELEREFQQQIARVQHELDPTTAAIEEIFIAPRKSDTEVVEIALLWRT
jgi:hypothetical protein